MKKQYAAPGLVEYGRVDELTLGAGGTLPDLNTALVVVNDDCPTEVTGTFTRVACIGIFS
jgi:hypothetical protein